MGLRAGLLSSIPGDTSPFRASSDILSVGDGGGLSELSESWVAGTTTVVAFRESAAVLTVSTPMETFSADATVVMSEKPEKIFTGFVALVASQLLTIEGGDFEVLPSKL